MTRLIKSDATSLILRVKLVNDAGSPIVDRTHSDVDLVVKYRRKADATWQTVTKVLGTLSTYVENGWIGFGGGWHELCLPNAAIVPGQRTEIEITYSTNRPQADSIDAILEDCDLTPILNELPTNLDVLSIDNVGRVRMVPPSIAFSIGVPTAAVGADTPRSVYVKERNKVVSFTANVNIEAITLELVFEDSDRLDILVVANASLTKAGNVVTYTLPDSLTATERTLIWGIREATDKTVFGFGQIQVTYAPHVDV